MHSLRAWRYAQTAINERDADVNVIHRTVESSFYAGDCVVEKGKLWKGGRAFGNLYRSDPRAISFHCRQKTPPAVSERPSNKDGASMESGH